MTTLAIEGAYKIKAAEPDGDSIQSYPNDASQWSLVPPAAHYCTNHHRSPRPPRVGYSSCSASRTSSAASGRGIDER